MHDTSHGLCRATSHAPNDADPEISTGPLLQLHPVLGNDVGANPGSAVAELLDELGLAIGALQVEIVDFKQAEACYVHHTRVPVAVAGFAMVSPAFARGRFPKYSFLDLIQKRPSMDETEACALAAVCGAKVSPPFWGNPEPFGNHLWNVIARYQLEPYFERVAKRYGSVGEHYLMRPRGFDWNNPDQPEIPGALAKWRVDYKRLPPARQLMVATILQLYRQGDDPYWMVRVPKKWHASEGVEILHASGALQDWARLYALYPGW